MLWALVIMQFTFIGDPINEVVKMDAWKAPYVFADERTCRAQIDELLRLSPKESVVYDCEPVSVD